jgi:TfoX/Sxy family transcriptional regulator of competence genes
MAYDEQLAERVRRILKPRGDVAEKKMMGGLSFMAGGAMCCSASGKGGLLVRVDPKTHEALLGEDHVEPADIAGRRMTGFVRVAAEGYRTDAALKKWVERGLAAAAAQPKEKQSPAKQAPAKRSPEPSRAKGVAKPKRKRT